MLLTPISYAQLPGRLHRFGLGLDGLSRRVLARIAATMVAVPEGEVALSQDPEHHAQALTLLAEFGMAARDIAPEQAVTWDGRSVAVRMEPSVIIHEVAHFQLAPASRRGLVDFGLGAGPETGDRSRAEADRQVFGLGCDQEEAAVSLLGVLWEAMLGQPAVLAFIEQNWLEGGDTPHNLAHFEKNCLLLAEGGFIRNDGRPLARLSDERDQERYQQSRQQPV